MKRIHLLLACLCAFFQGSVWAATYTYTGPNYVAAQLHNFTACPPGSGNCGAYTPALSQTGSFTTAAPLPGNLNNQDITALVTSFSFSDGLTTYASGDPQVTMISAQATTTGGVLDISIRLLRWQTPAPHVAGDHLDTVTVQEHGQHNAVCTAGIQQIPQGYFCGASNAGGVFSSWTDSPLTLGTWAAAGVPPVVGVQSVPTLGEWGVLLLACLMAGAGSWHVRRRLTI